MSTGTEKRPNFTEHVVYRYYVFLIIRPLRPEMFSIIGDATAAIVYIFFTLIVVYIIIPTTVQMSYHAVRVTLNRCDRLFTYFPTRNRLRICVVLCALILYKLLSRIEKLEKIKCFTQSLSR